MFDTTPDRAAEADHPRSATAPGFVLAFLLAVALAGVSLLVSPAAAQDDSTTSSESTTTEATEPTPTTEATEPTATVDVNPLAGTADAIDHIDIEHNASQSSAIGPGEDLSFTVTVSNRRAADISGVIVEINFPKGVFTVTTTEEDDERTTTDTPGILTWNVGDLPGESDASLTYRATAAATFPAGVHVVQNGAAVIIDGRRGLNAVASVPLAAPVATGSDRENVTELDANHVILIMAMLIGLAAVVAIAIVWRTSVVLAGCADEVKQWKSIVSNVLTTVAVLVIATAVILLAIRGTIGEDGAVSILAGIAGYVLGRTVSD